MVYPDLLNSHECVCKVDHSYLRDGEEQVISTGSKGASLRNRVA